MKKVVDYIFCCGDPKGIMVTIQLPVQVTKETNTESLKAIITSFLNQNGNSWGSRKELQPVDAFPKELMDTEFAPSAHFIDPEFMKFKWVVELAHPKEKGKSLCREWFEVLTAPYILNSARLKMVEEEICSDLIQKGYNIIGLTHEGCEALSGTPEDIDMVEEMRKTEKEAREFIEEEEQPEKKPVAYYWIKVFSTSDSMASWILAEEYADGRVFSALGEMESINEIPEEDIKPFTESPFKGYQISPVANDSEKRKHDPSDQAHTTNGLKTVGN